LNEKNQGLKRLQNNIKKLIDVGCKDGLISYVISHSSGLNDLNSRLEDELSYIK